MSETSLVILIIPVFIVCFVLFWSLIVLLISRLAGWAELARQYPARGPATGRTFAMRSARFGLLGSYRNCLTVTLSLAGIHMQPMIVFRMGHPPLLIPWTAIVSLSRRDVMFSPAARLKVKDAETGGVKEITFYGGALVEALEAHARTYKIDQE
ncbi:hypothetical protein LP7551_00026 [Roseibium album]|nr:hypothetical protein LP7551_00026 [Roseibium album]